MNWDNQLRKQHRKNIQCMWLSYYMMCKDYLISNTLKNLWASQKSIFLQVHLSLFWKYPGEHDVTQFFPSGNLPPLHSRQVVELEHFVQYESRVEQAIFNQNKISSLFLTRAYISITIRIPSIWTCGQALCIIIIPTWFAGSTISSWCRAFWTTLCFCWTS